MNIKQRLEDVLKSSFEDASVDVGETPFQRVHALVVSGSFRGVTDRDRQDLVWQALKRELSKEEQQHVSFVLASTPEEEQALEEHPSDVD